jgi:hypothetical protein
VPDTNSLPENLDSVLRKYGKIWIWSILSAAIAAFSVRSASGLIQVSNMLTFGGNQRIQYPAVPMVAFVLIQTGASLFSVYCLLQFLRYHVLPILFPPAPAAAAEAYTLTGTPEAGPSGDEASTGEAAPAAAVPDGGALLYRAFAAVVIAVAADVAAGVGGALMTLGRNLFS